MEDERKDKREGIIYRDGEIIGAYNGEVEEERAIVMRERIIASDYQEWQDKRHHEIFMSEKDRRLWGRIWNVGRELGMPAWLCREVYWFFKKARILKMNPEFKGKGIYCKKKYIYAVFYVVAKKRGYLTLADQIASMPCDETGVPCYINRKKGDPEFKKYLKIVLRYASKLYPNNRRDPSTLIDIVCQQSSGLIPSIVCKRAKEYALRLQHGASGKHMKTIALECFKRALIELVPYLQSQLEEYITRCL